MGGDNAFLHLVVRSDINSYADLRGKALSVDALTTGFAFVLRKTLVLNGLAERDVTFERAGGALQKRDRGWGGRRMRYPASEKLEIIRTVEISPLPVRRTLAQIGIPKSTFYAWLDRHAAGGLEGLEDRKLRPRRVWNRIPDEVRQKLVALALEQPELSPGDVRAVSPNARRGQRVGVPGAVWHETEGICRISGGGCLRLIRYSANVSQK
jgi:hypothetical protein